MCCELVLRPFGICGCGEADQQGMVPGSAGIQELWQSYAVIQVCSAARVKQVQVKHFLQEDLFCSLIRFVWRWRNEHKQPVAEKIVSKESNTAVLEER